MNRFDFTPALPATEEATTLGSVAMTGSTNSADVLSDAQTLSIQIGSGSPTVFTFHAGTGTTAGNDIYLGTTTDMAAVVSHINSVLGSAASVSVADGAFSVTSGSLDDLTIAGTASGLGLTNNVYEATPSQAAIDAVRVNSITAANSADFITQTITGGTVTVYTETGAPANVQLRWAKIDSEASGGADTWNLYYQSNSGASGATEMWRRVDQDFTFVSGTLSPAISETNLTGVTIDGVTLGALRLDYGTGGITQFNDPNGTAGVNALNQNGYAAGEFVSVAINDNGRVVVSYSNNQQVEVAQVITANFNAANQLKRLDGGIFAETADSGSAILDMSGGIVSSSLESSNTDISEEFTKLIVTQQAYAAGTRIVSTADQMIQEALNMVR
jgi:flagellar hook protein FlgE